MPSQGTPWSPDERQLARQMYQNGMGPAEIGRHLGRTRWAVSKQLHTILKVPLNKQLPAPTFETTPRQPKAKPLPPGAHTLPPLPSELATDG